MRKKSDFLTFLAALIPGVGYMYYGLIRKGVEALAIFLLIDPVFGLVGLSFLKHIVKILLWFYTFFDTYNIARRINAGEIVEDSDFIISFNKDGESQVNNFGKKIDGNKWYILGWFLIIIGTLAVINKVFNMSDTYYIIKHYISNYIVPALFILGGGYLLYKNKK